MIKISVAIEFKCNSPEFELFSDHFCSQNLRILGMFIKFDLLRKSEKIKLNTGLKLCRQLIALKELIPNRCFRFADICFVIQMSSGPKQRPWPQRSRVGDNT